MCATLHDECQGRTVVEGVRISTVRVDYALRITSGVTATRQLMHGTTSRNTELVLLPRLFRHPCFYRREHCSCCTCTGPARRGSTILRFLPVAGRLKVILPVDFCRHSNGILCGDMTVLSYNHMVKMCHGARVPSSRCCRRGFCFAPKGANFGIFSAAVKHINIKVY